MGALGARPPPRPSLLRPNFLPPPRFCCAMSAKSRLHKSWIRVSLPSTHQTVCKFPYMINLIPYLLQVHLSEQDQACSDPMKGKPSGSFLLKVSLSTTSIDDCAVHCVHNSCFNFLVTQDTCVLFM